MPSPDALFPILLAADWPRLAAPVRQMHGDAPLIQAHGKADVDGSARLPVRLLRSLLGLPEPGPQQTLKLTIQRNGTQERWTRQFAGGVMQSTLDLDTASAQLRERLGPVALCFSLQRIGESIDWHLRGARVFGLPCPRGIFGKVLSRSESEDGRYAFAIDVRLPLLGQLIAYRGWLEIVDGD